MSQAKNSIYFIHFPFHQLLNHRLLTFIFVFFYIDGSYDLFFIVQNNLLFLLSHVKSSLTISIPVIDALYLICISSLQHIETLKTV